MLVVGNCEENAGRWGEGELAEGQERLAWATPAPTGWFRSFVGDDVLIVPFYLRDFIFSK